MPTKIVPRHKILAFMGVRETTTSGGTTVTTTTYYRMTKFTQLSTSKNPIEYGRQYVDEPFTVTDVMGYSPSISYAFDKHTDIPVHNDLVKITNDELLGDDAVRSIIVVNTETNEAVKRDYAVIPNTEGDNINVYTYSGTFKVKGELIKGTAATSDNYQTITFTETSGD